MSRYIDVENIRVFVDLNAKDENGDFLLTLADFRRAIAQTPTADVKPVKRGAWIVKGARNGRVILACSTCGGENYDPVVNYCPHCGAKMR